MSHYPKIVFYIGAEQDAKYFVNRIIHTDPHGLENRIKDKGMDKEVIEKIITTEDKEEKYKIGKEYIEGYYKENQNRMEGARGQYQKIWDDNSEKFFKIIDDLTQTPWKFDTYNFMVHSWYSKAAWGNSNNLAIWWKREPESSWHIVAYELLLAHFFESVDKFYDERPIPDGQIWKLAEAYAHIVVYREGKLHDALWPNIVEKSNGYAQLQKLIEDLYEIYEASSGYKDFVIESVEYIKKEATN